MDAIKMVKSSANVVETKLVNTKHDRHAKTADTQRHVDAALLSAGAI